MTTEIIQVELNVYEKNLNLLLAEYKTLHEKYVNSIKQKNSGESTTLLSKLDSMNQQIQLLSSEIISKIEQINSNNQYGKYKGDIVKKKAELNNLNSKMNADEAKIKQLMHDMIDLDGKNETMRVKHKASIYFIFFYILFIGILIYLCFRMINSSQADPLENILLVLAILLLIYIFWSKIMGGVSSIAETNITYDSSSFLYRMLN